MAAMPPSLPLGLSLPFSSPYFYFSFILTTYDRATKDID